MRTKDELRIQLEKAFDYAVESGSFHRMNTIDAAEHVCVYGLGKYFRDAFIEQDVKRRFHVDLLCDADYAKLSEVVRDPDYAGLQAISLDDLSSYSNIYVIVMLGNPLNALEEIGKRIGPESCVAYNDVALDDVISKDSIYRDKKRFADMRHEVFKCFDSLEDDKSREIYVNIICNRIAPQYVELTYTQMCQEPQYFPEDLFLLSENECFVDGGAYIGDTLESFLEVTNGKFDEYHAFEMDKENYESLRKFSMSMEGEIQSKVYCHKKGLWDETRTLSYGKRSSDDSYSIYNGENPETVETVSLDEYLEDKRITFYKLDIEGAEWKALQGAKAIIANQKPKLAICIYHRVEDAWKIPLFIKELVPEYKIAIRHHAKWWVSETVCYAYI